MSTVLLEQIINSNYIRYDRLTQIINTAFVGSNAEELNVYIDVYSILKQLYRNTNYDIDNYSSVTSCIINMVAHYRHFFRTRYRVETKFFIVASKNCSYSNQLFYKDYNSKNNYAFKMNKIADDMILANMNILNTLCPYLPDVHFIHSTFETGVVIYDLICRNETVNPIIPHVIITKDLYNYQLSGMRDNIVILRPKKYKGNDISYFINSQNLMLQYAAERKIKDGGITTLSPALLSLIMTLSSVKERNIKSATNINKAIQLVKNAIDNNLILNGYNYLSDVLWNGIENTCLNISKNEFENRFKSIDISYQHSIYMNSPESKMIKLLNLIDDDAVREISNTYFKDNPLDLNAL